MPVAPRPIRESAELQARTPLHSFAIMKVDVFILGQARKEAERRSRRAG
jgi:hypothetical protein